LRDHNLGQRQSACILSNWLTSVYPWKKSAKDSIITAHTPFNPITLRIVAGMHAAAFATYTTFPTATKITTVGGKFTAASTFNTFKNRQF